MEIYKNFTDITKYPYPVVALGNFDGVHVGHRKLINEVMTHAREHAGTSVLITFRPNTKVFFGQITEDELIYTEEEKLRTFKKLGVDVCVVLDFPSIKHMTAEEFVKEILVEKLGMKEFVIGYDTNFGSDKKGDKQHLEILGKQYGFNVTPVEPLEIEGKIVSSTELRKKHIL